MARLVVKVGVQPKIVEMTALLSQLAADVTVVPEVVITSAADSTHSRTSLHFAFRALDIRTKSFPDLASKEYFAQRIREEFGTEYDVILEDVGSENEHLHIEWDPS